MTSDGSPTELIGTSAGIHVAAPLFTKLFFLNYDYDNDDHLSLSEILYDFTDIEATSISKDRIRDQLKALDGIQELRSLDLGTIRSLFEMLQ